MPYRTFQEFVEDDSDRLMSETVRDKIQGTFLQIYMRRCLRWPGAFELANVRVTNQSKRGKGIFKTFLLEHSPRIPLLVEQPHPRLAEFLERLGWHRHGDQFNLFYANDLLEAMIVENPRDYR